MKFYFGITIALLAAAVSLQAAPYSGSGPGTSIIDAAGTADYLNLGQAVAAVNAGPDLTGGDWTFLLRSDTTEASNIALGRGTGGFNLRFRPDTGSSVTVLFTNGSTSRARWAIGTTNTVVNSGAMVKTDKVIIDGSNNGTTSQNLTFRENAIAPSPMAIIQVAGDSDGCEIRNCTVIQGGGPPAANPLAPLINYHSYYDAANGFTNAYPDSGIIENNYLVCYPSYPMGAGVASTQYFAGGGPLPLGQLSTIVRNNTIFATRAGIYLDSSRGADVSGNTISVNQSGQTSAHGILCARGGLGTGIDVNIYNNRIVKLHGDVYQFGLAALLNGIACGNASTGFSYNIFNNTIANVQAKFVSVGSNPGALAGIFIAGSLTSTANIWHNSIHIAAPPVGRSTNFTASYQAVGIAMPEDPNAGRTTNAVLRNNIICNEETTGTAFIRTLMGTVSSDYNAVYLPNGSAADLTQWQTGTGLDLNSTYADPRAPHAPAAGVWTSPTDLHFTSNPGSLFQGTPVAQVTTDIDGQLRSASLPFKGADEILNLNSATNWAFYW